MRARIELLLKQHKLTKNNVKDILQVETWFFLLSRFASSNLSFFFMLKQASKTYNAMLRVQLLSYFSYHGVFK